MIEPASQPIDEHLLDRVEREEVSTRWRLVCTCGWHSEYRARTFLWTHFNAHLGLDLEDGESRLAVMYAVAAAIEFAEGSAFRPYGDSRMQLVAGRSAIGSLPDV